MLPYEILEHTGDAKIRVFGATKEELFLNALKGMGAILKSKINLPAGGQKSKIRKIEVQSQDLNSLLVDFLSEVNYLRQLHHEMYETVTFHSFSDTQLEAELEGRKVEEFGEDIKAVTFHELDVRQNADGLWQTDIVFDV